MEFKEFKNETGKILKEYWITPAEWDALDKTTVQEGDIYHIVGTIDEEDLSASLMSKIENNAKINSSNTFTESQIFNKDITINGNIIQNGDTYKTHSEELYTKKNIIFTREGAISTLGDNEYTGIQAVKYDGTNDGQLVFDKDGTARVGDVGDTQPLTTRSEKEDLVGGNLLQWDADSNKIIDAGKSTGDLLVLKTPAGVQTDFVQIVKSTSGEVRQVSATGVATVGPTNKAAYQPVLRGSQGQLTCLTAPEANQTDYDCVNRGELKETQSNYVQKVIDPSRYMIYCQRPSGIETNPGGIQMLEYSSSKLESTIAYRDENGVLKTKTSPESSQSEFDCINRGELNSKFTYYNHNISSFIKIAGVSYSLIVNFISTKSDEYTLLADLPVTRMDNIDATLITTDSDGNSYKSRVTASYYTDKIFVSGIYIKSDATSSVLLNTQVEIVTAIETDTVVKIS